MSLKVTETYEPDIDQLTVIEETLDAAGWAYEREEDDAIQCIAPTRWGEMGGLFAARIEPPAIHFSVTLDVKPQAAKANEIAQLVIMANERLWLGHFDYWAEEGVVLFRHALPMLDRDAPSVGEIRSLLAAAIDSIDRFTPAFNFVAWAGKTPAEAIEAAFFETAGEA
ncbi:MAG: YbjN domain-containing protein [Pseudomonadota bacterium]